MTEGLGRDAAVTEGMIDQRPMRVTEQRLRDSSVTEQLPSVTEGCDGEAAEGRDGAAAEGRDGAAAAEGRDGEATEGRDG